MNARRLGIEQPLWRPLAIGIGADFITLLCACAGIDFGSPFLFQLGLTCVSLVAIWHCDLSHQEEAYSQQRLNSQHHWIAPLIAGSPLALMTIVGWGLLIFVPDNPNEIVQNSGLTNQAVNDVVEPPAKQQHAPFINNSKQPETSFNLWGMIQEIWKRWPGKGLVVMILGGALARYLSKKSY